MRRLAIFDIDGTLTVTRAVNGTCFVRAFVDVFGMTGIDSDWEHYLHVTDAAITNQVLSERWSRPPTRAELESVEARLEAYLHAAARKNLAQFVALPGAQKALALLPRRGWSVAIATGGWRRPSMFKLAQAGITIDGIPWASSSDATAREDIIALAIQRAREKTDGAPFERMVYIGDGTWDVRAAAALRLGFVGLGRGARAARLREAGARRVLGDLNDLDRLVRALDGTEAPAAPPAEPRR